MGVRVDDLEAEQGRLRRPRCITPVATEPGFSAMGLVAVFVVRRRSGRIVQSHWQRSGKPLAISSEESGVDRQDSFSPSQINAEIGKKEDRPISTNHNC